MKPRMAYANSLGVVNTSSQATYTPGMTPSVTVRQNTAGYYSPHQPFIQPQPTPITLPLLAAQANLPPATPSTRNLPTWNVAQMFAAAGQLVLTQWVLDQLKARCAAAEQALAYRAERLNVLQPEREDQWREQLKTFWGDTQQILQFKMSLHRAQRIMDALRQAQAQRTVAAGASAGPGDNGQK